MSGWQSCGHTLGSLATHTYTQLFAWSAILRWEQSKANWNMCGRERVAEAGSASLEGRQDTGFYGGARVLEFICTCGQLMVSRVA